MGKTKIAWPTDVWEPVSGCTKISPGCDNCYAERLAQGRLKQFYPEGFDRVTIHPDRLGQPFHWRRPGWIFVCSRSDLFHDQVPWGFIHDVFETMRDCPQHVFLLLTKRPDRMAWFADNALGLRWEWPSNVWAGVSVESQKYAPRLDVLARVPAKVRFVSYEPALERVDFRPYFYHCACRAYPCTCKGLSIHWLIAGGESGPGARLVDIDWLQDVREQCQAAGVAFFMKQDSGPRSGMQGVIPDDLWSVKEFPEAATGKASP